MYHQTPPSFLPKNLLFSSKFFTFAGGRIIHFWFKSHYISWQDIITPFDAASVTLLLNFLEEITYLQRYIFYFTFCFLNLFLYNTPILFRSYKNSICHLTDNQHNDESAPMERAMINLIPPGEGGRVRVRRCQILGRKEGRNRGRIFLRMIEDRDALIFQNILMPHTYISFQNNSKNVFHFQNFISFCFL